jgi:hypothetical protein
MNHTYEIGKFKRMMDAATSDEALLLLLYRISCDPKYRGVFDAPINDLEKRLKLSILAIEGLKLKAKFDWIEDITTKHEKPFKDMTYDEIVDLSTAYYRQIRKDNKVFPGKAVKMCIDKFGVEPVWR